MVSCDATPDRTYFKLKIKTDSEQSAQMHKYMYKKRSLLQCVSVRANVENEIFFPILLILLYSLKLMYRYTINYS